MKKLMIVIVALFIASVAFATISTPIQVALNTSTYTAVQLGTNQSCSAIGWWTEDGTSYYISTDSAGSDAILVPADTPLSLKKIFGKNSILFYAKATAGTPNLSVIVAP